MSDYDLSDLYTAMQQVLDAIPSLGRLEAQAAHIVRQLEEILRLLKEDEEITRAYYQAQHDCSREHYKAIIDNASSVQAQHPKEPTV